MSDSTDPIIKQPEDKPDGQPAAETVEQPAAETVPQPVAKVEEPETKVEEPVAEPAEAPETKTEAPAAEPAEEPATKVEEPAAEVEPADLPVAEPAASATTLTKPAAQAARHPAQPAGDSTAAASSKGAKTALAWVAALAAVGLIIFAINSVAASPAPVASAPPAAEASTPPASASAAAPTATASAAATGDLSTVKVAGGDKPVITAPVPFVVAKTSTRVLTPGTGKAVVAGQRVTIDYLGVNGTNGKTFDTSFGKPDPVSFIVGDKNLIKGMVEGLTGVKVGSRVLIAIPAVDGYGSAGAPDAGIGPTDTLLFLVDVKAAVTPPTPLARATGTAVKPKDGLPTVTLDSATGAPTLTVPKTAAPTTLIVQPLITGKGATVTKGQTISVHYTGMIWTSAKVFDSSWTRKEPSSFAIGTGNVIPGWDKGLVGQKVGSQVLLVIPPADGYGTTGAPDAGITATDTLVFVVDILAAS